MKAITHIFGQLVAAIALALSMSHADGWANEQHSMAVIQQELTNPAAIGDGIYSWFGFQIYQAKLWTEGGSIDPKQPVRAPLALSLTYSRDIAGKKIASASADEITGLKSSSPEKVEQWLTAMRSIFPDVVEGDTITGVVTSQLATRSYLNERFIGEIVEPEFSRAFFAIWLDEKTSAPDLRKQLLRDAVSLQ